MRSELKNKRHNKMKKRGISTLEVHRILADNGIHLSKRTLHGYLDDGVLDTKNEMAAKVIDMIIEEHDRSRNKIKAFVKSELVLD